MSAAAQFRACAAPGSACADELGSDAAFPLRQGVGFLDESVQLSLKSAQTVAEFGGPSHGPHVIQFPHDEAQMGGATLQAAPLIAGDGGQQGRTDPVAGARQLPRPAFKAG